jgi:hypothetical protein
VGSRDLLAAARRLAAALAAGAAAGLLVGGVGGRVAMFLLRLTSDAGLHGRLTDDGFTIGIVSGDTLFLLVATTILGAMGGLAYLLVRPWLPERRRPWVFGALAGVVGGATILRPGGIDFTLLEPLTLAVAMFIAIPALGGALIGLLAERFLRDDSAFARSWASLALLLLLLPMGLLGGPLGGAVIVGTIVLILITRSGPGLLRIWTSTPGTWVGRTALAAIAALASVGLAADVTTIL